MLKEKLMKSLSNTVVIVFLVSFFFTSLSACDFTIISNHFNFEDIDDDIISDTYLVYNHKLDKFEIYNFSYDFYMPLDLEAIKYYCSLKEPLSQEEFITEIPNFALVPFDSDSSDDWLLPEPFLMDH